MDPEKEAVLGRMVSVLHQCLLAVVYSREHSGMDLVIGGGTEKCTRTCIGGLKFSKNEN